MGELRSATLLLLVGLLLGGNSVAGPASPDCSVDKVVKHTAEKATAGVSTNRCSPSKAVKSADRPTPHGDKDKDDLVDKARDANGR